MIASPTVRYEALKGYVRRGAPRPRLRPDRSRAADRGVRSSASAALDALGELCKDDEGITTLTSRSRGRPRRRRSGTRRHTRSWRWRSERRTGPSCRWRPCRRISSGRCGCTPPARRPAAERCGDARDSSHDDNDNVREAALPVRCGGSRNRMRDAGIVAALGAARLPARADARRPAQGEPAAIPRWRPLVDALKRLTAEKKETSRDIRVGAAGRARDHGTAHDARALRAAPSGLRSGRRHRRRNAAVQVDRQHGCRGAATRSRRGLGHSSGESV